MNYFELYPGDYLRDTTRLTLSQHGAYLRLLMTYFSEESPLPQSHLELFIIVCAVSRADKDAVRLVADRFFPVGDDGLRHNWRADQEIEKAQKRIRIAQENGAKGGRKPNPAGNPAGSTQETQRATQRATQRGTHSGEALHTPHATRHQEKEISPPNGVEVNTPILNGHDLAGAVPAKPTKADVPFTKIIELYHQSLPMLPAVEKLTDKRRGYIRQRWAEDLPTLDAWRNYFADVAKSRFLTGQAQGVNGRPPFMANLEWLCNPSNFTKVAEGNYHR